MTDRPFFRPVAAFVAVLCLILTTDAVEETSAQEVAVAQQANQVASQLERVQPAAVNTVSLNLNNASLQEAIRALEQHTNYRFSYSSESLPAERRVTMNMRGVTPAEALHKLVEEAGMTYEVSESGHVIPKERAEQSEQEVQGTAVDHPVQGTVTDAETGAPIPGVNVVVQGTTVGTTTDPDGVYELTVPSDDVVLVFSFVGYLSQEISVGQREEIDVVLEIDIAGLEEVVVGALDLQREARSLTHSIQSIDTDMVAQARELNVVNTLTGKVPGLSIYGSGEGVGGASRVVLRGNRSISGTSEPLYVVDGVPIRGQLNNLNPDDIASISVLKGPNAAALYGSRANNGAIVVTTKRGTANERGFEVRFNQNVSAELPDVLIEYQDVYGQGDGGVYDRRSMNSWGPEMDGRMVQHWSNDPNWPEEEYSFTPQPDNVRDFFQTGYRSATTLSIDAGGENHRAYFSYNFTDAAGVVPNNELTRHSLNLRLTNDLTDRLSLDSRINYSRETVNNRLPQSVAVSAESAMRHPYRTPRNIDMDEARTFEFFDEEGRRQQHFWHPGFNPANPFWVINRATQLNVQDRVVGFATMRYSLTDNFDVQVRSAIDRVFGESEQRYYAGTSRNPPLRDGYFGVGSSEAYEWNTDFLATYRQDVSEAWYFDVNLGGSIMQQRNTGIFANTGAQLTVPELFDLSNTQDPNASYSYGSPKDIHSVYGFGQLAYRNAIFLDITARNDWSSALPEDNRSFFYPSIGLGVVVSDLVETLPSVISFAQLRASYAEVGNDTSPYQLQRTASIGAGGLGGFLFIGGTLPNENLRPERTRSVELGAELALLEGRLGADVTVYRANSIDQLFTINLPVGSGAANFFTNGGNIQNQGIELMLSANPISAHNLFWNVDLNFARNVSEVIELDDERPSIGIAGSQIHTIRVEEGKPWGEIYGRGFVRDDEGRVVVGSDGLPQYTPGQSVRLGNFNPDWTGSVQNTFQFGNVNFNFLIDIRQGGNVVSMTNSVLAENGVTLNTLEGRDGSLVFGDTFFGHETAVNSDGSVNDIPINVEAFWKGSGGRSSGSVAEVHTSDASNMRLREMSLGYSFSDSMLGVPITISLVGRNLFFFYNNAQYLDPEVIVGTGTGAEGYNYYAPPFTRSIGLNIDMTF